MKKILYIRLIIVIIAIVIAIIVLAQNSGRQNRPEPSAYTAAPAQTVME